jgi:DNA-binding IclR family transcriptional regulator
MGYVMVEVQELAYRLRETPETIHDSLLLLQEMGRAELYDRQGPWRLRLADTFHSDDDGKGSPSSA